MQSYSFSSAEKKVNGARHDSERRSDSGDQMGM
jgi:hypothetical protein